MGLSEDEDDSSLLRSVSQSDSDVRLDTSIDGLSMDSGALLFWDFRKSLQKIRINSKFI
jgi:hypothetical protein